MILGIETVKFGFDYYCLNTISRQFDLGLILDTTDIIDDQLSLEIHLFLKLIHGQKSL